MQTDSNEHSLFGNVRQAFQGIGHTATKLINLASLESRLAGLSFFTIIGLVLVSSFLLFAAWLSLLIAGAIWLIALHVHLIPAMLIIAGVNLALLLPIVFLIKSHFKKLLFPATRRQLKISYPSQPQDAN